MARLAIRPMVASRARCHMRAMTFPGVSVMAESATNPLTPFSDRLATLVEDAARSIVAVHGGRRWTTSGIHWRAGVVVTAEEALEGDDVAVTLPDGRRVAATLAG